MRWEIKSWKILSVSDSIGAMSLAVAIVAYLVKPDDFTLFLKHHTLPILVSFSCLFLLLIVIRARRMHSRESKDREFVEKLLEDNYRVLRLFESVQPLTQKRVVIKYTAHSLFKKNDPRYGLDELQETIDFEVKSVPLSCFAIGLASNTGMPNPDSTWRIEQGAYTVRSQQQIIHAMGKNPNCPKRYFQLLFFEPLPDVSPSYRFYYSYKRADGMKDLRQKREDHLSYTTRRPGDGVGCVDIVLFVPCDFGTLAVKEGKSGNNMTKEELKEYPAPQGFCVYGYREKNVPKDYKVLVEFLKMV